MAVHRGQGPDVHTQAASDGRAHRLRIEDFASEVSASRPVMLELNHSRLPVEIRRKFSPFSQCLLQLCEDQLERKLPSTGFAMRNDVSITVQIPQNG